MKNEVETIGVRSLIYHSVYELTILCVLVALGFITSILGFILMAIIFSIITASVFSIIYIGEKHVKISQITIFSPKKEIPLKDLKTVRIEPSYLQGITGLGFYLNNNTKYETFTKLTKRERKHMENILKDRGIEVIANSPFFI